MLSLLCSLDPNTPNSNHRVRGHSYLSICRGVAACNVSSISQVKPLIHMFTSSSDVAVRGEHLNCEDTHHA